MCSCISSDSIKGSITQATFFLLNVYFRVSKTRMASNHVLFCPVFFREQIDVTKLAKHARMCRVPCWNPNLPKITFRLTYVWFGLLCVTFK